MPGRPPSLAFLPLRRRSVSSSISMSFVADTISGCQPIEEPTVFTKADVVPVRAGEPARPEAYPAVSETDRRRRVDFDGIAANLRPDLFRYAFWLGRDAALADDVVQEALLRAWQAFGGLRDAHAVKQWLLTIVRREHARVYERKRLETADIDDLTPAQERLIATTENSELREMRQAIFRLQEDYREPLVLQVLMGHTTDEIAEIMGIKPGTVLIRLFRARRMLKALLGLEE
jgi:RNA polymerase sigma-70 factor, ECF subfamily